MITISEQAFLFLACVKTGIIMGILYDVVRVLRRIFDHPNWLIQIEDLLYWVACGCLAFIMIFWRNYGQIRGFVFVGILIGAVLYFTTISRWVINIVTQIIKSLVIIPIQCIMKIISIPIRYVFKVSSLINKKRKIHSSQIKGNIKRRKDQVIHQLKIIKIKK